jgi:hypothetical protein
MNWQSGRWARAAVGGAVLGLVALAPRPVAACMLDNTPSITASGRTAVFSAAPSGPVNPAHYAPFMIPGLFGTGSRSALANARSSSSCRRACSMRRGGGSSAMARPATATSSRTSTALPATTW